MEIRAPFRSIYRPRWYWRAFAFIYVSCVAIFTLQMWREALFGLAEPKPKEMMLSAALLLAGVGFAVHTSMSSVRFTVDSVEKWGIFGIKRLPLSKIRGRREYVVHGEEGGGTPYFKLESNDALFPTMDFSKNYSFDDAFCKWFYSLPDLDAKDKEVHKDSNFGLVQSMSRHHAP